MTMDRGNTRHGALMASVSFLVMIGATGALAQGAPAQPPGAATGTALDEITVTATRTEERAVDTMASVSVTNRKEIQTQQPSRLGTIISQMPGVTTQENPNDPATSINIRGLQDFGRVAVTVDGARQNFQRSGHNANGAFFLDPAFVRTIDVTRGPVANIYGSGAIGGVASFETVDPKDILKPGEKFATELGFTGVAGGRHTGAYGHGIGAIRPFDWLSGLVGLSFRETGAYRDGGGNKILDSGQELRSGLAKLVLTPGDGHTIKLSGHYQKYDFANGLGTGTAPRRTNDVTTSNLVARYSFSRPDNDWLNLNVSVYRTTTETDQTRISGTPLQIGQKRFFDIETHGADINNTTRYQFGALKFATTYGVDFFTDRVKTSDPFSNGDETTPSGRRLAYGGFVQQHVKWGMFDVIGALRFDGYELAGGNTKSDGQRLSPKLTIGFTPIEGIQPYVTYAEGYRSPSVTETLVNGLHPFPASFVFIPNPNLRPEIGKTLEAGINLKFDNVLRPGDKLRGKFSIFENRVSNFIEAQYSDPGNDCGNPFIPAGCNDATFTYGNVARARLRGIEGEVAYDAGRWFASVSGSMIRGDNLTLNQPLESIFPDKVSLAGGVRFLDDKLVIGARATLVAKQNRLPAATLLANASKSYGLFDANIAYEVAKDTRLFAIAENIGDVRYRRFRDGDRSPGFVAKFGFTTRLGM
jgi:hemoglobin/transferrin/lactoferrin receptor protein